MRKFRPAPAGKNAFDLVLEGKVSAELTDELNFIERSGVLSFLSRRSLGLRVLTLLRKEKVSA